MKDQLVSLLHSDLSWAAVTYPAVSIDAKNPDNFFNLAGSVLHLKPLGAYTDSVREGSHNLQSQIESYHRSCSLTRFIVGGYSQGAQAVGDAIQRMPAADRDLVAAAGFFGDPYFNARSWSARGSFSPDYYGALGVRSEWPVRLKGFVFSYCHDSDPVCNISQKVHILGTSVDIYVRNPLRLRWTHHGDYATNGDGTQAADEIAQALGYPLSQSPLDVAFVIDSTGSMSGAIATVRDNVNQLAATIATQTGNYRFGLTDYKDEVAQDSAYQARLDTDLTNSLSGFRDAVSKLSADGGGDTPESVYDGIMTALRLHWRPGASHAVVLIGDAPAKDPEPVTHYTLQTVADTSKGQHVSVFAVQVGASPATEQSFSNIATATDGAFLGSGFDSAHAALSSNARPRTADRRVAAASTVDSGLLGRLETALLAAAQKANAALGGPYDGVAGASLAVSGAASTSTAGTIDTYAWDFDGNGSTDETTSTPTTSHIYSTPGAYTLKLSIRTVSGATSSTSTAVRIGAAAPAPSAPIDLSAKGGRRQVELRWRKGTAGLPTEYALVDQNGYSITVLADDEGAPPASVTIGYLADGTAYRYSISAINEAGGSPLVAFPDATTDPAATPATTPVTGQAAPTTAGPRTLPVTGSGRGSGDGATAVILVTCGLALLLTGRRDTRRRGGEDTRHRKRYARGRTRLS